MKMRRFLEHNKWIIKWVGLFGLVYFNQIVSAQNTEIQQRIFTTGKWVKLEFNQSDVYKISYNDLKSWGFNPASMDPRDIHFYSIQPFSYIIYLHFSLNLCILIRKQCRLIKDLIRIHKKILCLKIFVII
jgi:hypothetical protein